MPRSAFASAFPSPSAQPTWSPTPRLSHVRVSAAPRASAASTVAPALPADLPHFRLGLSAQLVGAAVFAAGFLIMLVLGDPGTKKPLAYLLADVIGASLVAVGMFRRPRLALAIEAAVGVGVYLASAIGGLPVWTYRFGHDREALQLFAKYVIVFGAGTLVLGVYKLHLSDATRRARATAMSLFVLGVLTTNMLWTCTYECDKDPLHCWLLRVEAVVLAIWIGARAVTCIKTGTPIVKGSYSRVVELHKTAPALAYVTGMISIEWVAAYTVWNVGFVIEQFTDVVAIQDVSFWLTMLYFRSKDEYAQHGIHAYFYEARAVSLGSHMTVSALFGILERFFGAGSAAGMPWISSLGTYEQYAPQGTKPALQFAALANVAFSAAFALPACASAWRAARRPNEFEDSSARASEASKPPASPRDRRSVSPSRQTPETPRRSSPLSAVRAPPRVLAGSETSVTSSLESSASSPVRFAENAPLNLVLPGAVRDATPPAKQDPTSKAGGGGDGRATGSNDDPGAPVTILVVRPPAVASPETPRAKPPRRVRPAIPCADGSSQGSSAAGTPTSQSCGNGAQQQTGVASSEARDEEAACNAASTP
jgi:hypothetical protein